MYARKMARALATLTLMLGIVSVVMTTGVVAHGVLLAAEPAPESALEEPPREIRIEFLSETHIIQASVTITGAGGATVSTGSGNVERTAPATIAVTAPVTGDLQAGSFTVFWTAVFEDGHEERGAYGFTVLNAGAGASGIGRNWIAGLAAFSGVAAIGGLIWLSTRHQPATAPPNAHARRERTRARSASNGRRRHRSRH